MSDHNWELLASGFQLVEGPTLDTDGSLVFSDVMGGGVHRLAADGTVTTLVPKRKVVGGIALHADGGVVFSGRDVQHARDGVSTVLLAIEGLPGFNDMCADAAGRLLVGAVRFRAMDPAAEVVPGELWCIDLDGTARTLYGGVIQANGVAVSADGGTLVHADTRESRLIVHDLHDDASVSNRRHWDLDAGSHPDGLKFDESGAVWVADAHRGRILRLRPDGSIDGIVDVPARTVTSLCFDGDSLIAVTADNSIDPTLGGSIFRTAVGVRGAPVHLARIPVQEATR